MPVAAAMATGQAAAPQAPRPKIRLQAPDTPKFVPLILPTPEALGVTVARPKNPTPTAVVPAAAPLDWNLVHARLQRLGALGFHLDRMNQGKVRVSFLLPAGEQRTRAFEVVGDNDASAVAAALQDAESWARTR